MSSLKIRDVEIGKGTPKIIAPICDRTKEEILSTAKKFSIIPVDFDIFDIDIVEWRVDWYEYYNDYEKIEEVLEDLRKILKNIPLVFTIKTNKSHGEAEIDVDDYINIYKEVCASKLVDIIDIEDSIGKDNMKDIIENFS
ncbi:MAG: type I 3-dehydroquinate dehydratase, partial [Intestinibacter sp.]